MVTKVETGLVRERKLSQVFEFPVSLEAFQEVEISSKASGQIISMKVSEGERVRKGQLLFELDARGDRIALVRAEAELEKAQYDLQRLEAGVSTSGNRGIAPEDDRGRGGLHGGQG